MAPTVVRASTSASRPTPSPAPGEGKAVAARPLAELAGAGPMGDLSPAHFQQVAELLYAAAGIRLGPGKEGLVRSRLGSRFRALGLSSFDDYLPLVTPGPASAEFRHFVDVLTTNKTNFFRESAHFDLLERVVFPALAGRDQVRIWSAGCSTGEEPYTLAMVARDTLPKGTRTRILATDISTRVLDRARKAVFPAAALDEIPDAFRTHLHRRGAEVEVVEPTRSLVAFAHLNLMERWPMRGPFDAIFCRNVMIYFDRPTQERLVQRFEGLLSPGGYLFVGHSESLTALEHGLAYVQPAVYRREG